MKKILLFLVIFAMIGFASAELEITGAGSAGGSNSDPHGYWVVYDSAQDLRIEGAGWGLLTIGDEVFSFKIGGDSSKGYLYVGKNGVIEGINSELEKKVNADISVKGDFKIDSKDFNSLQISNPKSVFYDNQKKLKVESEEIAVIQRGKSLSEIFGAPDNFVNYDDKILETKGRGYTLTLNFNINIVKGVCSQKEISETMLSIIPNGLNDNALFYFANRKVHATGLPTIITDSFRYSGKVDDAVFDFAYPEPVFENGKSSPGLGDVKIDSQTSGIIAELVLIGFKGDKAKLTAETLNQPESVEVPFSFIRSEKEGVDGDGNQQVIETFNTVLTGNKPDNFFSLYPLAVFVGHESVRDIVVKEWNDIVFNDNNIGTINYRKKPTSFVEPGCEAENCQQGQCCAETPCVKKNYFLGGEGVNKLGVWPYPVKEDAMGMRCGVSLACDMFPNGCTQNEQPACPGYCPAKPYTCPNNYPYWNFDGLKFGGISKVKISLAYDGSPILDITGKEIKETGGFCNGNKFRLACSSGNSAETNCFVCEDKARGMGLSVKNPLNSGCAKKCILNNLPPAYNGADPGCPIYAASKSFSVILDGTNEVKINNIEKLSGKTLVEGTYYRTETKQKVLGYSEPDSDGCIFTNLGESETKISKCVGINSECSESAIGDDLFFLNNKLTIKKSDGNLISAGIFQDVGYGTILFKKDAGQFLVYSPTTTSLSLIVWNDKKDFSKGVKSLKQVNLNSIIPGQNIISLSYSRSDGKLYGVADLGTGLKVFSIAPDEVSKCEFSPYISVQTANSFLSVSEAMGISKREGIASSVTFVPAGNVLIVNKDVLTTSKADSGFYAKLALGLRGAYTKNKMLTAGDEVDYYSKISPAKYVGRTSPPSLTYYLDTNNDGNSDLSISSSRIVSPIYETMQTGQSILFLEGDSVRGVVSYVGRDEFGADLIIVQSGNQLINLYDDSLLIPLPGSNIPPREQLSGLADDALSLLKADIDRIDTSVSQTLDITQQCNERLMCEKELLRFQVELAFKKTIEMPGNLNNLFTNPILHNDENNPANPRGKDYSNWFEAYTAAHNGKCGKVSDFKQQAAILTGSANLAQQSSEEALFYFRKAIESKPRSNLALSAEKIIKMEENKLALSKSQTAASMSFAQAKSDVTPQALAAVSEAYRGIVNYEDIGFLQVFGAVLSVPDVIWPWTYIIVNQATSGPLRIASQNKETARNANEMLRYLLESKGVASLGEAISLVNVYSAGLPNYKVGQKVAVYSYKNAYKTYTKQEDAYIISRYPYQGVWYYQISRDGKTVIDGVQFDIPILKSRLGYSSIGEFASARVIKRIVSSDEEGIAYVLEYALNSDDSGEWKKNAEAEKAKYEKAKLFLEEFIINNNIRDKSWLDERNKGREIENYLSLRKETIFLQQDPSIKGGIKMAENLDWYKAEWNILDIVIDGYRHDRKVEGEYNGFYAMNPVDMNSYPASDNVAGDYAVNLMKTAHSAFLRQEADRAAEAAVDIHDYWFTFGDNSFRAANIANIFASMTNPINWVVFGGVGKVLAMPVNAIGRTAVVKAVTTSLVSSMSGMSSGSRNAVLFIFRNAVTQLGAIGGGEFVGSYTGNNQAGVGTYQALTMFFGGLKMQSIPKNVQFAEAALVLKEGKFSSYGKVIGVLEGDTGLRFNQQGYDSRVYQISADKTRVTRFNVNGEPEMSIVVGKLADVAKLFPDFEILSSDIFKNTALVRVTPSSAAEKSIVKRLTESGTDISWKCTACVKGVRAPCFNNGACGGVACSVTPKVTTHNNGETILTMLTTEQELADFFLLRAEDWRSKFTKWLNENGGDLSKISPELIKENQHLIAEAIYSEESLAHLKEPGYLAEIVSQIRSGKAYYWTVRSKNGDFIIGHSIFESPESAKAYEVAKNDETFKSKYPGGMKPEWFAELGGYFSRGSSNFGLAVDTNKFLELGEAIGKKELIMVSEDIKVRAYVRGFGGKVDDSNNVIPGCGAVIDLSKGFGWVGDNHFTKLGPVVVSGVNNGNPLEACISNNALVVGVGEASKAKIIARGRASVLDAKDKEPVVDVPTQINLELDALPENNMGDKVFPFYDKLNSLDKVEGVLGKRDSYPKFIAVAEPGNNMLVRLGEGTFEDVGEPYFNAVLRVKGKAGAIEHPKVFGIEYSNQLGTPTIETGITSMETTDYRWSRESAVRSAQDLVNMFKDWTGGSATDIVSVNEKTWESVITLGDGNKLKVKLYLGDSSYVISLPDEMKMLQQKYDSLCAQCVSVP